MGLPLEVGAQIANISPELAQEWLSEGRRLRSLGKTPSAHAYNQQCRQLADDYDAAGGVLVQQLRSYMLVHAARDPKACAQLLESVERDFAAHLIRRQALSAPPPIELTAADQAQYAALARQPDLAEPFVPLGLIASATTRTAKFTQTRADGSSATAEFSEQSSAEAALEAELAEQSDEALEYYAIHGQWPHDAPRPRQDLDDEVIDALGEVVEVEPDLGELEHALAGDDEAPGGPPVASRRGQAKSKATARPPAPPPAVPPPAPPPTPPAPALRRVDPSAGLRDLGPERQLVQSLEQNGRPELVVPTVSKVPVPPPAAPLRRVDPREAR